MVIERISKEPENHKKYLELLDYLDRDVIDKSMVSITIENLRVIICLEFCRTWLFLALIFILSTFR